MLTMLFFKANVVIIIDCFRHSVLLSVDWWNTSQSGLSFSFSLANLGSCSCDSGVFLLDQNLSMCRHHCCQNLNSNLRVLNSITELGSGKIKLLKVPFWLWLWVFLQISIPQKDVLLFISLTLLSKEICIGFFAFTLLSYFFLAFPLLVFLFFIDLGI